MPTRMKILIVDDEVDLTKALDIFLTDAGYTVRVANDGQSAKDLLRELRYDLVLLDLNMPGIDGIHVAQVLKETWSNLPILVITGHKGEYEDRLRKLKINDEHIMEKPLGLMELAEKVKMILGPGYHEESKKAVKSGIPKAKVLFIEPHDVVFNSLFYPYFNELNKSKRAAYELVLAEDKDKALTLIRIYQSDVILLNTAMIHVYADLQKELQDTKAIPKEIIVHGKELYLKKIRDLGLDPNEITAIEGGVYNLDYPKRLEEAVREIAYRHGLVESKSF